MSWKVEGGLKPPFLINRIQSLLLVLVPFDSYGKAYFGISSNVGRQSYVHLLAWYKVLHLEQGVSQFHSS